MKKLIEKLIFSYGFLPMLVALDHYIELEEYETCNYIIKGLGMLRRSFDIHVPTLYSPEAVQEMKKAFNEFGLTGEIALNNTPYYAEEIIKCIDRQNEFDLSNFNQSLVKALNFNPKQK